MRKKLFSFILLMCMAVGLTAISASAAITYEVYSQGTVKYDMAYDTLNLINAERKSLGRGQLVMDKTLMGYAVQRAAELSVNFAHTRPDGRSCFEGFSYSGSAAENIAYGYGSANDVYKAWKNSTGHHNSYINGIYTRTGLGCMYINGTYYWAQVFDSSSSITALSKPSNFKATKNVKVTKEIYDQYAPSATPVLSNLTYNSNAEVTLKWTPTGNTTSYRIYRFNNTYNGYEVIAELTDPSVSTYVDSKIKGGTTPKYKVRPITKKGDITAMGYYSSCKSVLVKPATPSFTTSSADATSVYLKWSRANCDGYRLLVLNPATNKYSPVSMISGGTNNSFTVTGLTPNTIYTFKVRAYYKPSNTVITYSAYSPEIVITTSAAAADTSEIAAFTAEPELPKTDLPDETASEETDTETDERVSDETAAA